MIILLKIKIKYLMDFNNETEPLLDKKDDILEVNNKPQNEFIINQKSKRQILNRVCSCSDFCENLMFCCIDYDLTNRQYELYNDLKNKLSFPYNQNDLNHEKLLQDFFDNINDLLKDEDEDYENINDSNTISTNINNESKNNNNDLIKKLAYRVGFQNDNPRTDFRAGGFCSLQFMNYFSIHHKIELKQILKEKYFSFVLTSINLSFCLRLVAFLTNINNIETTLKTYNLKGFTRKQIKSFSEHLEKESENNIDFFFELLSQCFIFIFKKYMEELEFDKKNENLVKINSITRTAIACFEDVTNNINKNEDFEDKLKNRLLKELKNKL